MNEEERKYSEYTMYHILFLIQNRNVDKIRPPCSSLHNYVQDNIDGLSISKLQQTIWS
jgi:hypothetical protein